MNKDTILQRETIIMVADGDFGLYPSTDIFPSPDLYPQGVERVSNIVAGTMVLEKMIIDNEDFKFGQLFADRFEVTLYNVSDLSGKYIQVYQKSNLEGYVAVFAGIIDSCKLDRLGTDRQLVAYDMAYWKRNINVAEWWEQYWNNRETSTIKALRDSLCNHVGVIFENVELPNDNISIKKNVTLTSASFGDILNMICELNCCFPHFDEEARLKFIVINTEQTPKNIDNNLEGDNSEFQEYITEKITGVNFYDSSNELKHTLGDDTNAYIVSSNILIYDKDGSELNAIGRTILDYLDDFVFTPANVKLILSDFTIQLGQKIQTSIGNFYAFKINYSGSMLVDEEIVAQGKKHLGDEMQPTNFDSIITDEKFRKVKLDIDEVSFELGQTEENLENNYYTKTQTGTIIQQTVEKIEIAYTQAISNAKDEVEEYTDNKITIDNSGVHLKAEKGTGQSSSEVTLDLDVTYKPGTQEREAKLKVTADNISMTAQQTIDLMSGGTINLTSENMNIQSNNFSVTNQGAVTASSLTLTGGSIDIQNNQSGTRKREFKVNSDGTIEVHLANLDIDTNGSVTADSLTLTGGSIAIGDNFIVQEDGTMTANNMNLTATNVDGRGINIQGGRILFFDRLPVAPNEDSYIAGNSSGVNVYTGGQQTAYFSELGLNVNRGMVGAPKIVASSVTDTGRYENDGGFWEGNNSIGWERLATRKWVGEHSATIPENTNQVVYDLSQQDSDGNNPLVRISSFGSGKYFIYADNIKYTRYTYSSVADPDDYGDLIPFYGIEKNPFMGATPKFVHAYAQPKGQSDVRLKENIQLIDNRYENFYMSLNPVTFNFHANLAEEKYEKDRKRIGLIAQEVEKSLYDNGLDNTQFVYRMNNNSQSKYYPYTGNSVYILEYQDFHALHIHMIQKHENEIKELKKEIADLKEMVGDLVSIIKEEK